MNKISKTYRKDPYTQEDKREGKARKSELQRIRDEQRKKFKEKRDESRIQSD